ncbi:hypothetical protein [Streptomyces sp. NPDC048111]
MAGMVELTSHPDGTRSMVRREQPHPGARLSLLAQDEDTRHLVFLP